MAGSLHLPQYHVPRVELGVEELNLEGIQYLFTTQGVAVDTRVLVVHPPLNCVPRVGGLDVL